MSSHSCGSGGDARDIRLRICPGGQLPSCLTQLERGTRMKRIRPASAASAALALAPKSRTSTASAELRSVSAVTAALRLTPSTRAHSAHPWKTREPGTSSRPDRRRPGGAARCLRQSGSRRAREEGASSSLGWKSMASENILFGCAVGGIAGAGTGTASDCPSSMHGIIGRYIRKEEGKRRRRGSEDRGRVRILRARVMTSFHSKSACSPARRSAYEGGARAGEKARRCGA